MNELEQLQTRCVSHEIRNQVSICEMYSEIIKRNLEKEEMLNDSVSNAIDCIKKALKIIGNTLMDLKTITNFEPKVCDLRCLIEQSVLLSRAYTHGKTININCNVKNTAPVYADENKFIACIVNILKNGVEAIEEKGEINVSAKVDNKNAVILISNNGKPISKDKQKTIFEEGYTTKATGSGLGLHICRKNLENMHSTLHLNKSNDKITEFEIQIPVYASL